MSSSKVFRTDPHFTPIPLVRRSIAVPPREEPTIMVQEVAVPDPEPLAQETAMPVAEEPILPEPAPDPIPEPVPEPEPPIDLDAIRQEAYNQGMADQSARLQAEIEHAVLAFGEACQKIDQQRQRLLDHSRGDLINLIIGLSKKIVGQELVTQRNIIATTLQTALEEAIASEEYYVTLHPDDLAVAEAKVPALIASIRGLERIVFKTDSTLTRGGCLLESANCTVDATIEGQLASIEELLHERPELIPLSTEDQLSSQSLTADDAQDGHHS